MSGMQEQERIIKRVAELILFMCGCRRNKKHRQGVKKIE
jgi:hypothetical protein